MRDKNELAVSTDRKIVKTTSIGPHQQLLTPNFIESMAILIELLNKIFLQSLVALKASTGDFTMMNAKPTGDENIQKCYKLLPILVELIIGLNEDPTGFSNATIACFVKHHLVFLEFIYWCIVSFDSDVQFKVTFLPST